MDIGVLGGTGPAGAALALRLASVGYAVQIGSRNRERAEQVAQHATGEHVPLRGSLVGGDNAQASDADVVVIATPWDAAAGLAGAHRVALAGKVVISMANALVRIGKEFQPLVPPRGSVAAHVQAEIPESKVVGAFHHLPAVQLAAIEDRIDADVLICSDAADATSVVAEIVGNIPDCRPLDSGELSNATAIEAFTAVLLQLNVRYRTRAALSVTGIGDRQQRNKPSG